MLDFLWTLGNWYLQTTLLFFDMNDLRGLWPFSSRASEFIVAILEVKCQRESRECHLWGLTWL